jgi:putative hemolysin
MKENILQIDIDKVFKDKNPALYRVFPKFIIRWIKNIVHQDFINEFLKNNGHKFGLDFAKSILETYKVEVKKMGTENIPSEGRFVFASNHPLGGFDGIMLITCVAEHFPNVRFMVNDILMNLKNLDPILVPINKHGSQAKDSVKLIDEIYASDSQVLYFPAGLVSRKKKGIIADLEWKKSFISKAIKHKRDIIPVHISGRNTNRFYLIANLRKFFRIKWNLEMFLLPDELFKQQGKSFSIRFGKPISYNSLDNSKTHEEWAAYIKDVVYRLCLQAE